jgi:hypothetical protein
MTAALLTQGRTLASNFLADLQAQRAQGLLTSEGMTLASNFLSCSQSRWAASPGPELSNIRSNLLLEESRFMTREQLQKMRLIVNDQLELALRLKRIRKNHISELELVTVWLGDVRRISEGRATAAELVYAKSALYRCMGRLSRIQSEAPPSLSHRIREQISSHIESWRALRAALRAWRALTPRRAYR